MKKRLTMFLMFGLVLFSTGAVWGATEGPSNNFFGTEAGANNSGTANSFVGGSAGNANTSGNNNSFFGYIAGDSNTTAHFNSFFGSNAGSANTTGGSNSFFGYRAGYSNTTATNNSFYGTQAGYNNTEGTRNSFFGRNSGNANATGNDNSFLGDSAGFSNTTGNSNSFTGSGAGYSNTTGIQNSFYGADAGYDNTTGSNNSFFGYNAGTYNTTGNYNSFFGNETGFTNTTGAYNSFFGPGAGRSNTTGWYNNFSGVAAGYSNTEGQSNNFIGAYSGFANTTGSNNSFLGRNAGYTNTEGAGNVFLGYAAGYYETASNKLYIANSNTASPLIYGEFDNQYLEVNGSLNVQGTDDYNAFQYKIMGHSGGNSHTQMVTDLADSRLTVMAAEADDTAPRLQLVGPQDNSSNRGWAVLNYGSVRYNLWNAQFNVLYRTPTGIDYMLRTYGNRIVSFPTGNVGFGTTTPTHLIELAGGAYSNGATWVNASSRELKKNIKEVSAEEAIRTVENLKPVAFNYKKGDQDLHVGFIAEDVPELVATGDRKGLEPMDIVAVLTKVVQEMRREHQREILELQKIAQDQQVKIGQLETALQFKQDKNANVAQLDAVK